MKLVNNGKPSKKQLEESILKDIGDIRQRLSPDLIKSVKSQICQQDNQPDEYPVEKHHIMSVISHFTALKRAIKF